MKILKENRAFAMVDVVSGSEAQIVGFPLLLNDEESLQCEDIKLFVHSFETNTQIAFPVVLHNEAYTTQIAMDRFAHRRKTGLEPRIEEKGRGSCRSDSAGIPRLLQSCGRVNGRSDCIPFDCCEARV